MISNGRVSIFFTKCKDLISFDSDKIEHLKFRSGHKDVKFQPEKNQYESLVFQWIEFGIARDPYP